MVRIELDTKRKTGYYKVDDVKYPDLINMSYKVNSKGILTLTCEQMTKEKMPNIDRDVIEHEALINIQEKYIRTRMITKRRTFLQLISGETNVPYEQRYIPCNGQDVFRKYTVAIKVIVDANDWIVVECSRGEGIE